MEYQFFGNSYRSSAFWKVIEKMYAFLQMSRDELQEMTSKRDELESVVKK
jgi:hypothetical protein